MFQCAVAGFPNRPQTRPGPGAYAGGVAIELKPSPVKGHPALAGAAVGMARYLCVVYARAVGIGNDMSVGVGAAGLSGVRLCGVAQPPPWPWRLWVRIY